MAITLKTKLEIRIIIKSYDYGKMRVIMKDNQIEHLCFIDTNLNLNVLSLLDVPICRVAVLCKLIRDAKIKDYSS